MPVSPNRISVPWERLTWWPIAAALAATGALVAGGDAWVTRLGVPPDHPAWWIAAPVGVAAHLGAAHLAANSVAWWLTCRVGRSSGCRTRTVATIAAVGAAVGAAVWFAVGDGRSLLGASAAIGAAAAYVTVAGTGRDRWWTLAVCAALLVGGDQTAVTGHVAGIGAGLGAGVATVTRRRRVTAAQ